MNLSARHDEWLQGSPHQTTWCHPERSPALFLSRRSLAGAGRREGSAFCRSGERLIVSRGFGVLLGGQAPCAKIKSYVGNSVASPQPSPFARLPSPPPASPPILKHQTPKNSSSTPTGPSNPPAK